MILSNGCDDELYELVDKESSPTLSGTFSMKRVSTAEQLFVGHRYASTLGFGCCMLASFSCSVGCGHEWSGVSPEIGPAHREKFDRLHGNASILIDPRTRQLYDRFFAKI